MSIDQFGEQTYIKRGNGAGGLRGISTNAEQLAVWVGSFRVCAHLDQAIEAMYCHEYTRKKPFDETEGECKTGTSTKRKVKDGGRWTRQSAHNIAEELQKHSHPLPVK